MKSLQSKSKNLGLTLIELMIGLVLSLMVLGAAVSVFLGTKETFRLEEDLSATQENFRFIADRFQKDFNMMGYTGCGSPYDGDTPTAKSLVTGGVTGELIQGVEGGTGGSDAVTILYSNPESGIPIIDAGSDRKSPVYVSQNLPLFQALVANFGSGGGPVPITLMVANCDGADVFLVTAAATATGPNTGLPVGRIDHAASVSIGGMTNVDDELSEIYGRLGDQIATVYSRSDVTYAIDTVGGVTGLYETRDGGGRQLLLDNVVDMEIQYGIDSSGDGIADSYQDWSAGLVVSRIKGLKVELSMVVNHQNGVPVTKDYSFAVSMRNMGL